MPNPALIAGRVFLVCLSGAVPGPSTFLHAPAQTAAPAAAVPVPGSIAPHAWAVDAAYNELSVVDFNKGFLRYRLRTVNSKGDQTRDLIETRDGPVARLVLRDGRPLSPEQDSAERTRLQDMLDNPDAFHKHVHEDSNGKRTAADMIRLLPDAMTYTYAPNQPQRPGVSASEIVLDFQPNPAWIPPTFLAQALTGVRGRLWIDPHTHRMTHLDGSVFRGINLGWGVIAHVNPGGTFSLEQVDLGQGRSLVSHYTENISLRALMVKSLRENDEVTASQFQPVESMTYVEAIHQLLQTPLPR